MVLYTPLSPAAEIPHPLHIDSIYDPADLAEVYPPIIE